ncbi:MAG: SGNH/GDSL hydrolase family protein [Blastocatellia bacterium]|nr:SGNH/GDSL hydrolase family protein [Blastocatellia bacterium]
MKRRIIRLLMGMVIPAVVFGQNVPQRKARAEQGSAGRLAQLVEANVIAVHAYQVLLAKTSRKGDPACYSQGKLSDKELESLSEHQAKLLKSDLNAVRAWANGAKSAFDPAQDLEPILSSGLTVPSNAPVNIFTDYLRRNTKASGVKIRAVASLYQTVLEVERDGDRLQEEYAFYIGLGLPVYVGQFNLPGSDADLLAVGRKLEGQACESPVGTTAAEWQIAGRKIWNWGEKNLHIRDERVLAAELLREPDVKRLVPKLRAMPAQKIAVIGHSFTMGLHWSSPSSFVPIVIDVFRRENPKVEFKQFAGGGLTASRAQKRFYQDVLDWKPDKVMLVVMTRTDEDYDALKQMGEGFRAAGIETYMFDEVHDPADSKPGTVERAVKAAGDAGIEVIEVGSILSSAPDRASFVCLDGIHMTEPYHRLMAKEWLKYLAGARGATATVQ